ncbi:unnamed protein product [Rotaria socialis]|uniref:Beta-1,4-galactosyltransferase n=1 Tax=Rotaria socialis TaxID=392032 RepID=A0A817VSD4_9BILA|nr:unnamed protein product [Rotaria socialis]
MITSRKILRLKNNEHLPVITLAITIVVVIHLCNTHDERTANQYIMEDNEKQNPKLCPLYPSTLQGNQLIDMSPDMEWTDVEKHVKYVQKGGLYAPSDCTPRQHLAIIIPFRNREFQLKILLRHLHPVLQRQKRSYQVFVVEQFGNGTFNKGLIMNVAFDYASKISTSVFNCFMFHDVDLIPENDFNVYECDSHGPRHLAPAVDELRYFLMYNDLIGGVLAVTKDQFSRANGWSNLYWGWGFEDDDMNHRLRHAGYRISRPPNSIGRYKMIRHQKQVPSFSRYETLSKWLRYSYDGIRQLNTLDYSIQYYQSNDFSPLCNHYLSSIIFTIIHFIFVLSYNKILPWEIGLVVLFILLILHYARRLGASIFRWDLTWLPLGHQQEYDSIMSIVVVKFFISSLLLFGYTCQLCLTTVCTPSIYFNWFLVVTDCRYTYSYLLSSYTFAGGILISLSWTIVSLVHLIAHRFKS